MDKKLLKEIRVKVIAGARKEEVVGFREGELIVKVTTPPEKGRANSRVIELLAKWLDTAPSRIILEQGIKSPHKRFKIL